MKDQRGLTLSEILVALALASLILSIALPALTRLLPRMDLQATVDQLSQDLALARLRAVERRRPVNLAYDAAARAYRIDNPPTSRRLPRTVNPTAFPDVSFDSRGLLDPPSPVAISFSGDGGTRTVTVAPAGSIRVTQ